MTLLITSFLCFLGSLSILQGSESFSIAKDSKPNHDRVVACYVSTWATYRKGEGAFHIDDIDPTLCTHLIYAFAGLNTTTWTIRSLDPFNDLEEDYGKGSYKKMTALRKKHPHLTVSIAIGGWNEGSYNYSVLAGDPDKRRVFVDSVVNFIRKYDFNGFDLDWEFPAKRGGSPNDKKNFVLLVKDLHDALKPEEWSLTAALGAGKDTMDAAYDLGALNKYLDHIHLMCYDYHGKWDNQTGANAPLSSAFPDDVNTVEYSVNYMLKNGVDPDKLVLGLPMYGRTFHLQDKRLNSRLGAPSTTTAFSGPFTNEDGYMGFNEICAELNEPNSAWRRMWDDNTLTPFAVSGDKVIVYDDEESLQHKVKFAMGKKLGGVMIWSLDIDDFKGVCVTKDSDKTQNYRLLRSINDAIVHNLQAIEENETQKKTNEPTEDSNKDVTNTVDKSGCAIFRFPADYLLLYILCGYLYLRL